MRRTLLYLFLLVLLIPAAAYLGFPWYAKPLLSVFLRGSDITVDNLSVGRPGWNAIAVQALSLRRSDTGRLTVENAQVHYTKGFDDFRLSAERLSLVLEPRDSEKPLPDDRLLSEYLPGNYFDATPALEAFVQTIQVSRAGDAPGASVLLAIFKQVHLEKTPDILDLNGTFVGRENYSFTAQVNQRNNFNARVTQPRSNHVPVTLTGVIEQTGRDIAIKVQAGIDLAQPLYFNTGLDDTIGGYTGASQFDMQFTIENKTPADFAVKPIIRAAGIFESDLANNSKGIALQTGLGFNLLINETRWEIGLDNLPDRQQDAVTVQVTDQDHQHHITALLPETVKISGLTGETEAPTLNSPSKISIGYVIDNAAVAEANIDGFSWNGLMPGNNKFMVAMRAALKADSEKILEFVGGESVRLQNSQTHIATDIELHDSYLKLDTREKTNIKADTLFVSTAVLSAAQLSFPPQQIVVNFKDPSVNPVSFRLQADKVDAGTFHVAPLKLNGQASLDDPVVRFSVVNDKTTLRQDNQGTRYRIPPYHLSGEVRLWDAAPTTADLVLFNQCDQKLLTGKWQQGHQLALRVQQDFSGRNSLRRWLNLKDMTADIPKGKLSLSVDWPVGDTNAAPHIQASLQNANLEGSLGTFNNVQLSLSTQEAKSNTRYPLQISAEKVNIGAEVKNLSAQADFIASQTGLAAHIQHIRGDLLGGNAFVEDQWWRSGKDSTINVHVQSLDLSELVRTQSIDSLTTTGNLSGVIPVKLNADGSFALANGKLKDVDGGVIRYRSAMSESEDLNQELQLTLDVLKNFKYDVLDTSVQYSDGNLILGSKIFGSNPEVAGGQKIDLNLNTEVNLKSAFQAMRIQAGLEAKVEHLFSMREDSNVPFCQQPL